MGNCAGKPNDLIVRSEAPLSTEEAIVPSAEKEIAPSTREATALSAEEAIAPSVEIISVTKERDIEGETKEEEPSAKTEEPTAEAKTVEKEAVIEEAMPSKPTITVEVKVKPKAEALVEEKSQEETKGEAPIAAA